MVQGNLISTTCHYHWKCLIPYTRCWRTWRIIVSKSACRLHFEQNCCNVAEYLSYPRILCRTPNTKELQTESHSPSHACTMSCFHQSSVVLKLHARVHHTSGWPLPSESLVGCFHKNVHNHCECLEGLLLSASTDTSTPSYILPVIPAPPPPPPHVQLPLLLDYFSFGFKRKDLQILIRDWTIVVHHQPIVRLLEGRDKEFSLQLFEVSFSSFVVQRTRLTVPNSCVFLARFFFALCTCVGVGCAGGVSIMWFTFDLLTTP